MLNVAMETRAVNRRTLLIILANGGTYLKAPFDMEEFRQHVHKMVDFIVDGYYHKIKTFPVLSQVWPGYLLTLLLDSASNHPKTGEFVLVDVKEKIIPFSPNFFVLMPSNRITASYLGEMMCTEFARTVQQEVHPDIDIFSKAIGIMNSFINDIFEKLAQEASKLTCCKRSRRLLLSKFILSLD
eukprot:Gb_36074 [translate_table: standard]